MSETTNEYHAQLAGGAEEYLRECLRLRGGVTGIDHDDAQILLVLNALAAARREVETVNEEAERQAGVICNLNTDLATSRAALEDVRRVEAWIQAGNAPDLPEHSIAGLVNARYGAIVRWEDEETTVATGDSLEALGRALAQEAGDAMR